VSNFS